VSTFKHSGDIGDIIYSLPTIKGLGGGTLYLNPKGYTKFTKESLDLLKPLLESQEYIDKVKTWSSDDEVVYDLDEFRIGIDLQKTNLAWAHLKKFNLHTSLMNDQWLFNIGKKVIKNKSIIFHRSQRYHNNDWSPNYTSRKSKWECYINKYHDKILFIGLEVEYNIFIKHHRKMKKSKDILFYQVENFLELAEIINGSELFIGNQSAPFSIAEGLHANSILENCIHSPNCNFNRNKK
jgi:hypothetical protein